MESEGMNLLRNSTVLISVFVGACVLLLVYILKQLNSDQKNVDDKPKNEKLFEQAEKKKESAATGKSKKKGGEGRWTGRSDKQTYSHPWLLTSLKGHTAQVLDMDFASNGKYLASCAEEDPNPDPGGDLGVDGNSSSSSNSDSNPDSSLPSSATPSPRTKGLSRRQRKNRRRDDHSPPEIKKKPKAKRHEPLSNRKPIANTPLVQYVILKEKLSEYNWDPYMRQLLLKYEQRLIMGYPIESTFHQGRIVIFKSPMSMPVTTQSSYRYSKFNVKESRFDVNAREFVPGMDYSEIKAEWNANHDSGQGSGCSSDSGEVLDDSEEGSSSSDGDTVPRLPGKKLLNSSKTNFYKTGSEDDLQKHCGDTTKNNGNRIQYLSGIAEERKCARCEQVFYISSTGNYITQDCCQYHWGKRKKFRYTCCDKEGNSPGCTMAKLHVWNGLSVGFNGPYDSFVRTRPRKTLPPDGNYGVYALDCEMCYTVMGLELAKVTVVGTDGRLVYDSYVKPELEIIDYNTRFSGITAKDLNKKSATKTLREVQNDLMGFINRDTILVGHGLENDLRALRIVHENVIDTAVCFPHAHGLPFRYPLKTLAKRFLQQDIQSDVNGHNSFEDARAGMELVLVRVQKDIQMLEDICYR